VRQPLVESSDSFPNRASGPLEPTTGVVVRGAPFDTWAFLGAVTSLVVAGVAFRLLRLDERVLSFDEGYTFATAHRSLFDMLAAFRFEANGTLYAVLLWPLLKISESEAIVRSPAVIAGIATIPAVYWTGRELVGKHAALVGAAIVAVSPVLIAWSVYGRGYPLAILFCTLSFGCLGRVLSGDGRTGLWRTLYVASTLAMAYSSVLSLVVLPIHAIALWTRTAEGSTRRAWVVPALALGMGLLPLGLLLYVESTYRDPLHWLWEPDLALIRLVAGELAVGSAYFGVAGAGLAGAIAAVLTAIALTGVLTPRARAAMSSWGMRVILGWALFPPFLLLAVSEVRPVFWSRYLGIVVPALALLAGVILVHLPRKVGLLLGAILASVLLVASVRTSSPDRDYRQIAAWLEAERDRGEPIVLYPIEQLPPLAYYARELRVDGEIPVEEWNDTPLPPGVVGVRRDVDWGDSPVGPPSADDLARLSSRTGSVLVLTYPNLVAGIPLAAAQARGCSLERTVFDGLVAFSHRGCPEVR